MLCVLCFYYFGQRILTPYNSTDSGLYPSKLVILFKWTWNFLPPSLLSIIEFLPIPEYRRLRECNKAFGKVGKELINKKMTESYDGSSESKKDIMSVLGAP